MSAILVKENRERWKEMIVPIKGNVTYPITLDPTAWILDDRKILLEEAYTNKASESNTESNYDRTAQRRSQEVYQQKIKPRVKRIINRSEREKKLKNTM